MGPKICVFKFANNLKNYLEIDSEIVFPCEHVPIIFESLYLRFRLQVKSTRLRVSVCVCVCVCVRACVRACI